MAAKDRISKASEAARAAQRNRYLQRLVSDEELRGSLLTAYGATRSAYGRMANGKPATQALFEDRKLQRELKEAAGALRVQHGLLQRPQVGGRDRRGQPAHRRRQILHRQRDERQRLGARLQEIGGR